MKPETGGPAFPTKKVEGNLKYNHPGMSLRDYFAGQALAAVIANYLNSTANYQPASDAKEAYAYADAMLAESREEKDSHHDQ